MIPAINKTYESEPPREKWEEYRDYCRWIDDQYAFTWQEKEEKKAELREKLGL